ncbi:hypothetical protein BC827DRAFT_780526 [Russula dissimulans]|nr:hypothetical protein BC827DRAFT_780526 [Russula dissimulans]
MLLPQPSRSTHAGRAPGRFPRLPRQHPKHGCHQLFANPRTLSLHTLASTISTRPNCQLLESRPLSSGQSPYAPGSGRVPYSAIPSLTGRPTTSFRFHSLPLPLPSRLPSASASQSRNAEMRSVRDDGEDREDPMDWTTPTTATSRMWLEPRASCSLDLSPTQKAENVTTGLETC